ncbi:sulfate adenylyltransferase, partial [Mangrovactinospora gilvigrisea]
ASTARGHHGLDLALLTDGLRAEREQGITIDVAYRYFATPQRRFILADTPGHVQYTRNMVTGASTAQLTIVLVDARTGLVDQTRRHAAIAALLRVPHVVLAVNKMDLADWNEAMFTAIEAEFTTLAKELGIPQVTAIPISALHGDNVVDPSAHLDWYAGPTVLEHLETVPVDDTEELTAPARLPVQYVIRPPGSDYRGYAGRLESGTLHLGQPVTVLPSGEQSTIAAIDLLGGPAETARAGQSLTVRLTGEIDIARGDLIAPTPAAPQAVKDLTATACHLHETPLRPREKVLIQHGTRTVRGIVTAIDTDSGELALNEIAPLTVRTAEPLPVDAYAANRRTGAFLLIDPADGTTRTAAMAV